MKQEWQYLRWFRYVWKHRGILAAALLCIFTAMAVDIFLPKILGFTVDRMLTKEAIAAGKAALPFIGLTGLTEGFLLMLALLAIVIVIRSVASYFRSVLLGLVGEKVHLDIRQSLFDHLQRLPISYFDKTYTGKIMARVTTDTDALWHLLYNGILNVFAPSVMIVVIIVLLFRINVWLTLFSIAVLPVFITLFYFTKKRQRVSSLAQRETLSMIYSRLQERISGIRTIRIFAREHQESRSFMKELQELFHRNVVMLRAWATLGSRTQLLTGLAIAMVLCFGGIIVARGFITIGDMVVFYIYAGMLFAPVGSITETSTQVFTNGEVAMNRIFEVLDMPVSQELKGTDRSCPRLKGSIALKDVSFGYAPGQHVLKDINLSIRAGETVAFVGPSGAGKTTLINLICRFYEPGKGTILIDGTDVGDYNVESFRRQISYVSQESFLFSGTVLENIRFGKADATRQEIERAAKLANAHDFIVRLPQGYETETGERGVNLSGGQKQRINIARALIVNPSIIIMDEPTSALDAESESVLLEALKSVFRDKTCLIIAHRLSTVVNADRTVVLDSGRIVQQGPHKELAAKEGLYRDLCRKQFQHLTATM